ncbi:MAG: cell division protein FtsW [Planctomycetes bacterium]|nr:cell division protein FtsW [Planctomycetota bacterium]
MTAVPAARNPSSRAPGAHVRELDWLMMVTVALCCLGLVMAVSVLGPQDKEGPAVVLRKQGLKLLVGLIAFFVAAVTPMRVVRRVAMPLFFAAVAACILPRLLGQVSHGAYRWITVGGQQFQPVEPARFFLVLAVSWLLARSGTGLSSFRRGFLPAMGCAVLLGGALAVQPDNGNAMLAVILASCLALVAGVRFLHFAPFAVGGFALFAFVATQHEYVRRRLDDLFATKPGSQVGQGLVAVASGGAFGRGLGQGWMKMSHVPEAHNDFVFAIIGEELGYLGSLFVLGSFTVFGYVCYRLVRSLRDPFLRYAVCGYGLMICMQAAVNLLVVSGWAPAKGIDLPFVSTGGTSLVFCLAAVGLIGNAVRADRAASFSTADEVVVSGS